MGGRRRDGGEVGGERETATAFKTAGTEPFDHDVMSARGWILFSLVCVVWGIPYLLIKVAVEGSPGAPGVPVPVVVFARTLLGAALLLPFAVRARRAGELARLRRHALPIAAFARSRSWTRGGC